ncbi:ABC transporter permease [Cohnella xylanilytica]|uniref:ABC transporter permease n=1 Tax=Cohnella xylanilytica TaxID=557555 RepID=UPI001B2A8CC4|nr:ABC transporter permease [Cohnella xylanilytica]GIO11771.1 ABC transporter permease [Cohnella xylanilytica]
MAAFIEKLKIARREEGGSARAPSPFWVMVQKEFGDHIRSWRFIILLAIVTLACIGSIYAAVTALKDGQSASSGSGSGDAANSFLFLKMFTESDGSLPNFLTFLSFLAPLIGIAIGFDGINSERNKGTLSRVMSQPVYRDDFLNAKFVAGLLLIAVVVFSLGFLVMGMGLFTIGYPPTPEEFWRVIATLLITTVYVGLWLNLSLLFSVRFRQAATSALSGIAVWIFFLVFYGMIVNLVGNATAPGDPTDAAALLHQQDWLMLLSRLSPAYLFQEAASTLLLPDTRTLNPFITQDQAYLAINAPLSFGQSLLLVWPQVVAIVAETAISFAASYVAFMRQEIRSRS